MLRLSSPFILLLWAFFFTACNSSSSEDAADAERPESTRARLVDSIGVLKGEAPYMFGRIGGVAADENGQILVVDVQHHEIRVFDQEGTFQFAIGREGEGPGELRDPCCPAFDPEGHLWVRDNGNNHYNKYDGDSGFSYEHSLSKHTAGNLWAPTTFDLEGRLVDVGLRFNPETERPSRVRFHRSEEDEIEREITVPEPPEDQVGMEAIQTGQGQGYVHQPFGPSHLIAHGPDGNWATAAGIGYEVVWYDSQGDTLQVIERMAEGPQLSRNEEERAERLLDQRLERAGASRSDIPFGIPNRKPALRRLFFDENGRLWVQRSTAEGAPNEADVYDHDGELVEVVQWPRGIDLRLGWIDDDTILGISSTEEGAPQVVRLEY